MSSRPARLEVRDASGRGLRVEFVRVKDRYAHVISRLDGELAVLVWESVEGTDSDDWPASPPLQQLSLETLSGDRRVALLVGMAGTSHWSLSVEPAADGIAFIFDVACRVKSTPERLGSMYRRCGTGSSTGAIEADMAYCQVRVKDSGIEIAPNSVSNSMPHTARWKYRVART